MRLKARNTKGGRQTATEDNNPNFRQSVYQNNSQWRKSIGAISPAF